MNQPEAIAAAVLSSAAVLVAELTSVRLAAPYVGMTFETYTSSIGVALAAIALGANRGGRAADTHRPVRLIGPLLLVGGVLMLVARPIVLALGPQVRGTGPLGGVTLIVAAAAVPIAVLAAIPPIAVKTQLRRLDRSGSIVGRFSALGTIGGLVGTFLTGFVLLATLPVSWVLGATGIALLLAGLWYTVRLASLARWAGIGVVLTLVAGGGLVLLPGTCDHETAYYCARVEPDPGRDGGRVLYLDDLTHSYVDLDDPKFLAFAYTQWFAAAIDAHQPTGPVRALHIGGGGFTMPRWLAATHPGSYSKVFEVDPVVLELGREQLGLRTGPRLQVRTDDARTSIMRERTGSYDIVVGDAFGDVSVPWHLTTREFATDVERVLGPDGLYMVNVIDNPPLDFLAAEIATLRAVFPSVTVISTGRGVNGAEGGNFVILAGDRVPTADAIERAADRHEYPLTVATQPQVGSLARNARMLTDDYAPVDQLLTPYRYA
ncbi:MAG: hypothetical protein GEV07_13970 [Streptosporangiales bacterium]|nr:hypothetical protein [Streptosporangiales bacterium]